MFRKAIAVLVIAHFTFAAAAHADTFEIDKVHSGLGFTIKHMGVSHCPGRFDDFAGSYTLDDDASKCSFNMTIQAESVNTAHEGRDKHLTGPDFFNAKQFPTITFKSTQVTAAEGGWSVTGDLTMLGVTKPVTVTVTKVGEGDTGRAGYRSGIDVTGVIKRSEWGMNYGIEQGALSDEVPLTFNIAGVRK